MTTATGSKFSTPAGAVCRVGDLHVCPIPGHGTTVIVSGGATKATVGGLALAINGSVAGCGAVLNSGFAPNCSTV